VTQTTILEGSGPSLKYVMRTRYMKYMLPRMIPAGGVMSWTPKWSQGTPLLQAEVILEDIQGISVVRQVNTKLWHSSFSSRLRNYDIIEAIPSPIDHSRELLVIE
jgi:hypothetical protein